MEEILKELIELINRVMPETDTSNVTMKSNLRTDLSITSFNFILLSITIEDEFKIQIEEDFEPKTVEDVCAYIMKKV